LLRLISAGPLGLISTCGLDTQRCYKDADDALPWWWCLYDVTANRSQNWNILIL